MSCIVHFGAVHNVTPLDESLRTHQSLYRTSDGQLWEDYGAASLHERELEKEAHPHTTCGLRKQLQEKIATTLAVLSDGASGGATTGADGNTNDLMALAQTLNADNTPRSVGIQSESDASKANLENTLRLVTELKQRVQTRSQARKAALAEKQQG
jgi:hypothetical protein